MVSFPQVSSHNHEDEKDIPRLDPVCYTISTSEFIYPIVHSAYVCDIKTVIFICKLKFSAVGNETVVNI